MRLILILLAFLTGPLHAATEPVEVTTPGGLTVWLVPDDSIPILSLSIAFEGGAMLDTDETLGATRLMTGLLEEGAGDLDATAFAAARQAIAARISFSAGMTTVRVSAEMLTEFQDEAADLVALALSEPMFAPDAVERVREQALTGLRAQATSQEAVTNETFRTLFYGDHPFARSASGTVETVSALTVDDLSVAHKRALTRGAVTIGAVGDITPEALGLLVDRILGALPEEAPDLPGPADLPEEGTTLVKAFASPQSIVRFAQPGIPRDDPDFVPGFVLNHILGGGAGSRLFEEVREERGLTYGIGTGLDGNVRAPQLSGSVASANATVAEALALVRAEWVSLRDEGVTAEEVAAAKLFLTGSYPLRFTSNRQIANGLVALQRSGLPRDYILTRNDLVEAVTVEDVNRVARRLIDPDALTVVVVGEPEGLPVEE